VNQWRGGGDSYMLYVLMALGMSTQVSLNSVSGLVSIEAVRPIRLHQSKPRVRTVPGTLQEQSASQPITLRAIRVTSHPYVEFKARFKIVALC
jgi:hypothetical protein